MTSQLLTSKQTSLHRKYVTAFKTFAKGCFYHKLTYGDIMPIAISKQSRRLKNQKAQIIKSVIYRC